MPLVPEPFSSHVIMRQSVFFQSQPWAQSRCNFCPILSIPQYSNLLGEEKKAELCRRADKLYVRAVSNQHFGSSEFCWEACAWHDVFGPILDDLALRMSVYLGSFNYHGFIEC